MEYKLPIGNGIWIETDITVGVGIGNEFNRDQIKFPKMNREGEISKTVLV